MPAKQTQRSFVLIGAALALPIVVLVVVQLVFAFSMEREEIERRSLSRAEQIVDLADARLAADFSLMQALVTAEPFERRDWPAAFARAREITAINPHWRNVIVSDLESGEEVFSLSRPFDSRRRPLDPAAAGPAANPVGGVVRDGPGCPCIYLHLPLDSAGRYLITVAADPASFQDIVARYAPSNAVAGLIDRSGNFVGRSRDYEARVGTQATIYVRQAINSGRSDGIYEGVTWEGFRNHTAYVMSAESGWSAHIAIPSSLIDAPRTKSFITAMAGAVLALLLAAGLIFWALRDLAERRRAEARLAQTQKLEAIGQLTGGVAHDFNNLLTVMIGGLNMLLKRLDDPKQRQIAEHMLESARRGDKLTKQLLAFSRGKQMELAAVDLRELIPGMEELLRRSIPAGAVLNFDLHPEARWVRTDANQLELAILNLVINARDAMPDGGKIEVSTRPAPADDAVEIAVKDTGMGMPREVADRALEPFFTTKPAGKGTGLGLAQVYGAARQSGGWVEIDSTPGRGATVRLFLPRTSAPARQPEAPVSAPLAPPQQPGQSVLVVDDEPGVLSFMAETLREAGYHAVEASDPGAALRLLDLRRPDLLLTDFSMPGMTGLELAEHARNKAQGLRVLIVSGYADAEKLEASAARPQLLRKPFDQRTLLAAVRDALAA